MQGDSTDGTSIVKTRIELDGKSGQNTVSCLALTRSRCCAFAWRGSAPGSARRSTMLTGDPSTDLRRDEDWILLRWCGWVAVLQAPVPPLTSAPCRVLRTAAVPLVTAGSTESAFTARIHFRNAFSGELPAGEWPKLQVR